MNLIPRHFEDIVIRRSPLFMFMSSSFLWLFFWGGEEGGYCLVVLCRRNSNWLGFLHTWMYKSVLSCKKDMISFWGLERGGGTIAWLFSSAGIWIDLDEPQARIMLIFFVIFVAWHLFMQLFLTFCPMMNILDTICTLMSDLGPFTWCDFSYHN